MQSSSSAAASQEQLHLDQEAFILKLAALAKKGDLDAMTHLAFELLYFPEQFYSQVYPLSSRFNEIINTAFPKEERWGLQELEPLDLGKDDFDVSNSIKFLILRYGYCLLEKVRTTSKEGSPIASLVTGLCWLEGIGNHVQNSKKAFKCFEEVANIYPLAQYCMLLGCFKGIFFETMQERTDIIREYSIKPSLQNFYHFRSRYSSSWIFGNFMPHLGKIVESNRRLQELILSYAVYGKIGIAFDKVISLMRRNPSSSASATAQASASSSAAGAFPSSSSRFSPT